MKQFLGSWLVAITCLGCGCGHSPEPTRIERQPIMVGVESLVDNYHSGRKHYTGRIITLFLPSNEYRVRTGRIEARLCGPDEMIRCETGNRPLHDLSGCDIEVSGTCVGIVKDGTVRCDNGVRIDWYVRIVECDIRVVRGP